MLRSTEPRFAFDSEGLTELAWRRPRPRRTAGRLSLGAMTAQAWLSPVRADGHQVRVERRGLPCVTVTLPFRSLLRRFGPRFGASSW